MSDSAQVSMCMCACVHGGVCVTHCSCTDVPSRWPHSPLSWAAGRRLHTKQLTCEHSCIRLYTAEREPSQGAASRHLHMFMHLHTTCGLRLLVCMSDWAHVCYQDASPQLSHSFPAASRGWKREKPQTSGAPQPIRIVYLASHGRLAEQEHAASRTALLSLSLFPLL